MIVTCRLKHFSGQHLILVSKLNIDAGTTLVIKGPPVINVEGAPGLPLSVYGHVQRDGVVVHECGGSADAVLASDDGSTALVHWDFVIGCLKDNIF